MAELSLNTRYREKQFEADARVIVFDGSRVTSSNIADEVRDLVTRRPLTRNIYIAAPFINGVDLECLLREGVAAVRAAAGLDEADLRLWMLDLREHGGELRIEIQDVAATEADGSPAGAPSGTWSPIAPELIEGWLFDLFDLSGALVDAPPGVHFTKSSGKHSTQFLRTSSTLLSTAACGFIAMAALAKLQHMQPRRVFVDTAPLLSVVYAMSSVATVRGFWASMPTVKSFSSYGGKDKLPQLTMGDMVLISASTSGGLARELLVLGARQEMLLTIYYLASARNQQRLGVVACDLTVQADKTFGYRQLESHPAETCPLCAKGFVRSELEGDQFLIDRRSVKRLRLLRATQQDDARKLFEKTVRTGAWQVPIHSTLLGRSALEFRREAILDEDGVFEKEFGRLLQRFTPSPLDLVICVGLDASMLQNIANRAGVGKALKDASIVSHAELERLKLGERKKRNALVVFDVLQDHSQARTINAVLRGICNGGNVTYLAALTAADTARAATDLDVFLTFGERGRDTFTFKSAGRVLLPYNTDESSSWSRERALLQGIANNRVLEPQLQSRLEWLQGAGVEHEQLFLPAVDGKKLQVSPDFVFLATTERADKVSQGDIFAIVSNVLACARAGEDNATLGKAPGRDSSVPAWRQTSLFQTLLCPSNFKDFNDAILRAALLRGATEQELNYVLNDVVSAEMLDLLVGQLQTHQSGGGDALPEFLLALASGRMKLTPSHTVQLQEAVTAANLPAYLKQLASAIVLTGASFQSR
ncbi:hypothetical protein P3G55_21615 [Leptospira sp. 96542]|nr:hypothetical protein [Leptospira sp. 96542]